MFRQIKYNLAFSFFIINVCTYSAESLVWDTPEAEIEQKKEEDLKKDFFNIIFKRLEDERNAHLVIFNDKSEIFKDFFNQNVVARYFILALSDRETILCSKAILKNIQFKFLIWKDLLSLDLKNIRVKYSKFFENVKDDELLKLVSSAKKIDVLMLQLNSNQRNLQLEQEVINISNELQKLNEFLFYIFFMYKAYQYIVMDDSYNYLDVNQDYLLCIPNEKKEELFKDIPVSYLSAFIREQPVDFLSIYLGLHVNRFREIRNVDLDSNISHYQVNPYLDLGQSLQDAIRRIFVYKNSFSISESFPYLLPKFNVFLIGHGAEQEFFLGIEDRYIKPILFDLNNNVWMKNLLILSCYPAGRFKNLTNTMEADRVKIFSPLDYSVIFIGSLDSVVYSRKFLKDWLIYQDNFRLNIFKNTFKILDNESVNYEELLKEFSEDLVNDLRVANYVSILFPHTDWVTATDFSKNVLNLTKVKSLVLLDGELDIPQEKNIILLNTNSVFGTLNFNVPIDIEDQKIPIKILPVNYKKNQYFISKMKFHSIKKLDCFNQDIALRMGGSFSSQNSEGFGIFEGDEDSNNYCGKLLAEIFSFKGISIKTPIFIFIDQLVIEDSSNCKKEFYKVLVDIKDKKIFFNFLMNETLVRESYDWSKNELLIDVENSEIFFDYLRTHFIDGLLSEHKIFIQKIKDIPTEITDIPDKIKSSHSLYQIQKRLEELKKDPFSFAKGLNPKAKEFIPKAKVEPKTLKKRRVHNPYAKF